MSSHSISNTYTVLHNVDFFFATLLTRSRIQRGVKHVFKEIQFKGISPVQELKSFLELHDNAEGSFGLCPSPSNMK